MAAPQSTENHRDLITPPEFARRLGVTASLIQKRCKEGRVPGAMKIGFYWWIPADSNVTRVPQPCACKLIPQVQEDICRLILDGKHECDAARIARVAPPTLTGWLRKGKVQTSGSYYAFRKAVEQARSVFAAQQEGSAKTVLRCSGCKQTKPLERFSRSRIKKHGRANWCKDCMRTLYTQPIYLERRKQRRARDIVHSLYIETRCRARKSGIAFDIEELDLHLPLLCPVLGVPFYLGGGPRQNYSPSLDRTVNELGYVKGNVVVISWLANRIKGNHSDPHTFEAVARYLRNGLDDGHLRASRTVPPVSSAAATLELPGLSSSRGKDGCVHQ